MTLCFLDSGCVPETSLVVWYFFKYRSLPLFRFLRSLSSVRVVPHSKSTLFFLRPSLCVSPPKEICPPPRQKNLSRFDGFYFRRLSFLSSTTLTPGYRNLVKSFGSPFESNTERISILKEKFSIRVKTHLYFSQIHIQQFLSFWYFLRFGRFVYTGTCLCACRLYVREGFWSIGTNNLTSILVEYWKRVKEERGTLRERSFEDG